jgi:hypothetical protein
VLAVAPGEISRDYDTKNKLSKNLT